MLTYKYNKNLSYYFLRNSVKIINNWSKKCFRCIKMNKINNLPQCKALDSGDHILNSLKLLRDEVKELYLPKEIPVINEIPQPLDFYRNWVAPNIPVLIKGGIKNWKAVKKWNKKYFCEKFGSKKITVAVTPNGYADAINEVEINGVVKEIFTLPEERIMTLSEFYSKLENTSNTLDSKEKKSGIYYIQKQNSNLVEEFPELLEDIDKNLLWASDSFKSEPVAINLWIGDKRAVTSLHKDPMENIYCVISGSKEFILLPPTDRPWLPYKEVSVGQHKETESGLFNINLFESDEWKYKSSDKLPNEPDDCFQKVPWIAIDPSTPDYKKYPLYENASPIRVTVEKGDALYLPSLWFHYVRQSHECIAVNYWYDMNFDIKYAYFQLLEKLSKYLDNKESE